MAWKYPNNKQQIKNYREQIAYVPFTFRDETHISPFYRFEKKVDKSSPKIKPLEFQGDEIFQKEGYTLKLVADSNNQLFSHRSGKSLSSDSEDELRSEELLEMRKRVTKKGRRKAEIFQSFQFGLQLEDIFHNNLSSLAKNINEDQRSPGKTSFEFNNIRSGLLDEMDQVKGMIESHRNSRNALKSNENLDENQNELVNNNSINNNSNNNNNNNNTKEKKNKKQLSVSKQNKSTSQTQKDLLDLQIQGVSPKKSNENQGEEKKLFHSQKEEKNVQKQENEHEEQIMEHENLNDYLDQVIIQRGVNKKKGLRQIFILYKKFKGNFYSIQIEKYFIPSYSHITDNLELIQDFLYWKDYLSKWMKMRGKIIENVFTSNGFRIMNLNQVQLTENILIIQEEDGQLEFWHDFQIYHNIQLTMHEQRIFADHLNTLQTREDIYKALISQTILHKVLQGQQADKTPNTTVVNVSKQNISQNKGFLPNINTKQQIYLDPTNESSIFELGSNSKRKGHLHSKPNRHSQSSQDLQLQLSQIQKERLELVDLYSQYQNIMISSLGKKMKNPNKVSSISQGALLKQFNGVKMKVLQQSFPYLAQKKYIEAKIQNSSYKPPQFSEFNNEANVVDLKL